MGLQRTIAVSGPRETIGKKGKNVTFENIGASRLPKEERQGSLKKGS